MKREFVVKSIDAAPDASPYVLVSLSSMKEMTESGMPSTSGPKVMGFTNMNDMMKDLNKMLAGMGGPTQQGITQLKMDMREYKELGLAVGDKVYLELTKAESLGV
ncbi:MAG: hypothetical protein MPI95_04030 [Nitrosopumilus sp.]|nr:hypothetical protein [Nitrosopumilus sp.]CAI9831970.1 conserved hypothetical protein [Nitrosopumilaceae archaeon]MDA7941746.1 hypothetical protein [Nitrosopumilus sp.]MDA7943719.1 hypothetical protein [Nitrosopumilus sp.]MDA7945628.1 hypothetical protein [Nitrosopumilus sp.]